MSICTEEVVYPYEKRKNDMEILFENKECLACVKEPGILSQRGKPGEKDMVTELQKQHSGLGGIYLIQNIGVLKEQ